MLCVCVFLVYVRICVRALMRSRAKRNKCALKYREQADQRHLTYTLGGPTQGHNNITGSTNYLKLCCLHYGKNCSKLDDKKF